MNETMEEVLKSNIFHQETIQARARTSGAGSDINRLVGIAEMDRL